MRGDENSWRTCVILAFAIVSIIVIVFATIKSCAKQGDGSESTPAPEAAPVMKAVEITPKQDERQPWEDEMLAEIEAQMIPPERTRIGRCRLTVYNSTESHHGYATATGVRSQHLMTCAVDPKVIPYGSNVIVVDKDGEEWRFRAIDCGGFSGKWVDIFFDGSELGGIYWLDEVFGGDYGEVYWEEEFYPVIN